MAVAAVLPGDAIGINAESTADKQSFMEWLKSKKQGLAEKYQAWKEARQAKRDDKVFGKIRDSLIQEAFFGKDSELKYKDYLKQFEQAEKDYEIYKNMTTLERSHLRDQVAKGQKTSNIIAKKQRPWNIIKDSTGLLTGVAGVGKVVIDFGLKASIIAAESSLAAVSTALGVVIPVVGAIFAAVAVISRIRFAPKKAIVREGNRADAILKNADGYREMEDQMNKIRKFATDIENDKTMLIQKKRSLKPKEFKEFLTSYLKSKLDFLKELNAEAFLKLQENSIELIEEKTQKPEQPVTEKPEEAQKPEKPEADKKSEEPAPETKETGKEEKPKEAPEADKTEKEEQAPEEHEAPEQTEQEKGVAKTDKEFKEFMAQQAEKERLEKYKEDKKKKKEAEVEAAEMGA